MTRLFLFILWRIPCLILVGLAYAAFDAACALRETAEAIAYEWRNPGKKADLE